MHSKNSAATIKCFHSAAFPCNNTWNKIFSLYSVHIFCTLFAIFFAKRRKKEGLSNRPGRSFGTSLAHHEGGVRYSSAARRFYALDIRVYCRKNFFNFPKNHLCRGDSTLCLTIVNCIFNNKILVAVRRFKIGILLLAPNYYKLTKLESFRLHRCLRRYA